MTKARFLYNNFAASDFATITPSSELAGFDADNLVESFRFSGWRPTGQFTISATNKEIYINDGSDKTVSLTEAIYTTGALLAAHIQTRLNASSTLWTCTYSSTTFKFTIGRSSGTALLRLATTSNAVWNTIGYIGAVDDDVGTGQVADVIRIHTSEYVTFDLGEARPVTTLAVIGRVSEAFKIPATATVRLYANNINSFSSPALTVNITSTADGIFHFLDGDTTYRYWRFEFIDKENPAGPSAFDLRVLYLGSYESFTTHNINNGFSSVQSDDSIVSYSEGGTAFFRLKPKYWNYSFSIEWVSESDRYLLRDMFNQVGISTPFFISIDPTGLISETVGELTKYVTFTDPYQQDHLRYKYFSQSMSVREVVG